MSVVSLTTMESFMRKLSVLLSLFTFLLCFHTEAQVVSSIIKQFPNGYVTCVRYSETYIYVGGSFSSVGNYPIKNVARYNIQSGELDTSWHPMPNKDVRAIAINGNDIYLAGSFSTVGSIERTGIAKVSSASVLDLQWNPQIVGFDGRSTIVNQIAINEGYLYIGGRFDSVNSLSVESIARVSLSGQGNTDINWLHSIGGTVFNFAFNATDIYVSGAFSYVNEFDIHNLTKISLKSGGVDSLWKPNPSGIVFSVGIYDNMLYLGGGFRNIGGTLHFVNGIWTNSGGYPIDALARITLTGTGSLDTTWKPNPNAEVSGIAFSGNRLYISGGFTQVGGGNHFGIAKLLINGTADNNWNIELNSGIYYNAFVFDQKFQRLYFGGFSSIPTPNFSAIEEGNISVNPDIHLVAGSINNSDNTTVSFWTDNLGADNNAEQLLTQKQPKFRSTAPFVVNNNPVLDFSQDKGMAIPGSSQLSGGISKTIFAVIRTGTEVVNRQVICELGGVASGFNIYIQGFQLYAGAWNPTNAWHASRQVLANRVYLVQFTYDGSKMRLSVNGINGEVNSIGYSVSFSSPAILGTNNSIGIGAVSDQTRYHNAFYSGLFGDAFKGQIAEIMVLNTSDVNTRTQVFNNLNTKYKLGAAMQPLPKENEEETTTEVGNGSESTILSAFPNPSIDMVTLNSQYPFTTLTIYNSLGEFLLNKTFSNTTDTYNIDVQNFISGKYRAVIETEYGTHVSDFTVIR